VVSDYAGRAGSKEAADAAVALAPSDPEAHYQRGNVLADAGEHADAAPAYEAALALRPRDYVIWVELGKAREEAGDAPGALEAFRRAVSLAPSHARPRWLLGNALLRAGSREEAVAELRRAAEGDPSLYPNLIQTLWHAGGRDPRALVRDAAPRAGDETLALARFLIRVGEPGEGLRLLHESGARLTEEDRKTLVADLLAAERFAEAYAVWSDGRGAVGALTDGGFEEGTRSDEGFGWRFALGGQGVKLSLDAAGPREGARSLKVEYAGSSDPAQPAVSRLVAVEPGARYRLTFAARAKELVTGGPPFMQVVSAAKSGETLAETAPLTPPADGWRDFTLEFTAPAAGAVRVALRRKACATSPCPAFGGVWLDAFELRRLER
jgi:thioredoxin-like negative regulator of GroEL